MKMLLAANNGGVDSRGWEGRGEGGRSAGRRAEQCIRDTSAGMFDSSSTFVSKVQAQVKRECANVVTVWTAVSAGTQ